MSRSKSFSSGFGLFTANKIQSMTENRSSLVGVTASQNTGSIKTSLSASFRYDQPGQPLKSTQQLSIDWSKFENHTFFNSAEAKVNMAFETIINNYPFDGTKDELFRFEDGLTGFEKYVLETMPQYTGFLNFNNSQFVEVTDRAGTLYPSLSRDTTSRAVLDPGVGPFTYEMSLFLPTARGGNQKADKQVIAQKIKANNGITLYTEPTPSKKSTISYTGQPADGNTVSLISSDGTQKTYEFDPTVVNGAAIGSNVGVRIGTNADDTYGNLKTAILGASGHDGKIVASHVDNNDNAGSLTVKHLVTEDNNVSVFSAATIANSTLPPQCSTTQSNVVLLATSGSVSASSKVTLSRGKWHHVSACLNRNPGINRIEFYVDGKFISRSSQFEILDFQFKDALLSIGKGSDIAAKGDIGAVTFNTALSASIDDFRVFHSSRSHTSLEREKSRKVEPRDTLKLSLPFNEPTGSYNNQDVVLDHSGNSLHTKIYRTGSQAYDPACRIDPGYGKPMFNEDPRRYPVLFPSHPDLVSFNTRLMVSASNYDTNNPNMITKLVPDHYLREAHQHEGFGDKKELGDSEDLYGYDTDFPGGGKMGSPQIIAALLFIWAKQFDEMKLFLDQFGKVLNADYLEEDTVADNFLPFMAEYYGFDLPSMFPNVSMEQLVDREGQGTKEALAKLSLQQIQNSIWRRVLSDVREIMRSKGTIHGIKTFLRNVGIDPDRSFRFREYGGARTGRIGAARQEVKDIIRLLSFTGSMASGATSTSVSTLPTHHSTLNMIDKRYSDSPLIVSPFLSGTRVEGGSPKPSVPVSQFILANSSSYTGAGQKILRSGNHVKYGVSPEPNDGLFTSGSWSCEAMYVYGGSHTLGLTQPVTQSLMRMYVTGTVMGSASSEAANASITFTGLPADTSTIVLKDANASATTSTFEFESGGGITGGNVSVTIGATAQKTAANLVAAIKATSALKITPLLLGDGVTVRLTMNDSGTPTVTKIATTGTTNTSIKHFTGGFDDDILKTGFNGGGTSMTGRTMLTNLVALSGSLDMETTGSLVLFARPIPGREPLVLSLTGTNVFDGDRWNVCYGRIRNDLSGTHVSSSYFLHATKAVGDRVVISNRTEKLFDDHEPELCSTSRVTVVVNNPSSGDTLTIVSDDGTSKVYKFITGEASSNTGTLDGSNVKVCTSDVTGNSAITAQLLSAIHNNTNGHGSDVAATNGSIVIPAKSGSDNSAFKTSLDGTSFTIQDASGVSQKFTYFVAHDELTVGRIGIKSDTTIEDIAKSIKLAIELSPLGITPGTITSAGDSENQHTIPLVQDSVGTTGNQSFTTVGTTSPSMTYNNFTNGKSKKMTVRRFDNSIVITQDSNIAAAVTIPDSVKNAGRITKGSTNSAVNMSAFSNITNINKHGPFIVVGDLNDTITSTSDKTYGLDGYNLAANTTLGTKQAAMAQTTKFAGNIANIRFYSKALTEKEHREHALNLRSIGVETPSKNFSFAENIDGSFEKLRLDVSIDQDTTGTTSGKSIILSDFSQNLLDMEGYGFEATKQVLFPRDEKFSILSPNFDQSSQTNKVRIRSYLDPAVARRELVGVAPVYHIPEAEKVHDDLRFGVEISVTQALNEDIINILATMEEIENSIGAPESQFDVGYLGLENIREVYFNRLTDKINLSNFFQFFRWFDNTIGDTIHRLIPRKTRFTGVNYIIEPHILERPKFTYNTSDMYIGENDRHGLKGEILLRQLVAVVRRF